MLRTTLKISSIVGLLVLGLASFAWAQVSPTTGAIRGIVTDPSGAVVPGATVILTNDSLALRREVKTEAAGAFLFPLVPPASGYKVEIEAAGFQHLLLTDLTVLVTVVANANAKLTMGAVTSEVVVTGEAQPVQSTSAALGGVLGSQVLSSLPLPTRNVFDLLATDAGVAATLTSPAATILQGSEAMFVAGSRDTSNNYMLNGVDANNFEFHTLAIGIVPIPNPDAVQEFRTQTSLYDATSGFSGGGSITLLTRSGTSKLHGGVYEFLRNTVFNANDFFFNRSGREKPVMIQNQFGGSLGGPVPHLNKTFWFVNYEGMRQRNGIAGAVTGFMPVLPAQRDAASLAQAFGLPVSAIDPTAVKILNAPGPYDGKLFPSGTGAPVGTLGDFAFSAPVRFGGNQVNGRIDREFSTWGIANRFSGSYFWSAGTFLNPGGANVNLGQPYQYLLRNDSLSLQDTQTLRPNLLNEIVVGFTFNKRDIGSVNPLKVSDIGMSRFNSADVTGLPNLFFAEQMSCCGASASVEQTQHNFSFDLHDTISYVRGKHSLRFGFQARSYQFNFHAPPDRGTLVFLNLWADSIYGAPPAGVEDLSIRDLLIGAPTEAAIGTGVPVFGFRARDYSAFIQDDFHVTPRLMLNLGLRWDYLGNVTEVNDKMSNFDPSLIPANVASTGGQGLQNGFVSPAGLNGFGTPGVSPSTLHNQDKANFAPRVGFAYDVFGNGKVAVRGGFGLYYFRLAGMQSLQTISNPPFSLNTDNFGFLGTKILSNPFPTLPLSSQFPVWPQMPTLTGIDSHGVPSFDLPQLNVSQIDRSIHAPYKESWNLAIQWEFLKNWTVEAGYAGSRGLRLTQASSPNNALLRNANNPGPFGLATNSSDNREARVPIVGISSFGIFDLKGDASSVYHAALLTVSHQFSRNLFFKAAYTFSKSIDDAATSVGFEPGVGSPGNQFISALNRGLSTFDMTHRLVITYVYGLPGFREGFKKHILGNWSIAGITTYQSGFPGTVFQSIGDTSLSGTDGYGLVIPGCQLMTGGNVSTHVTNYLNSGCVSRTPLLSAGSTFGPLSPFEGPGTQTYTITAGGQGRLQGPSTRGAFRNPFQTRSDFSLIKTFPVSRLGEGGNVQFRAEFFKIFNTPIFNGPSSTAGTSSFGRISGTTDNTGRQIQFALKINF